MAGNAVTVVVKAKDEASRDVAGITDRFAGLGNVAGKALLGIGAAGVALGGAVGVLGFKFNAMREQAMIAFSTMLGSGEKAKVFLDQLAAFAAKTPFEFPDLTRAAQKMMAMGFESGRVIPMLTAVGDAAAGLHVGAEGVDRIVNALGQMQAKGKATSEEMMQLTELGIPAWQMLADKIGVTIPEAMKLVTKGAVDAETTITAVTEGMTAEFGGMMDAQSRTFSGALSTMKDTASQLSGEVMGPLFAKVTEGMLRINEAVASPEFQAAVDRMMAKFGEFSAWFEREGIPVIKEFGRFFLDEIAPRIGQALDWLGGQVRAFAAYWHSDLMPAIRNVVLFAQEFWNQWGETLTRIAALILDTLVVQLETLRDTLDIIVKLVKGDFSGAWDVFGAAALRVLEFVVNGAIRSFNAILAGWNNTVGRLPGVGNVGMIPTVDFTTGKPAASGDSAGPSLDQLRAKIDEGPSLAQLGASAADAFVGGFSGGVGGGGGGGGVGAKVQLTLEDAFAKIELEDALGSLGTRIMDSLGDYITDGSGAETLARAVNDMIAKATEEMGPERGAAIGAALMDALANAVNSKSAEALAGLRDMLIQLNTEIGEGLTLTMESFNKALAAVRSDKQVDDLLGSKGRGLMDAFNKALVDGGKTAVQTLARNADSMMDALEKKLPKAQVAYLGTQLMTALDAAITERTPATIAAIETVIARMNTLLEGGAVDVKTGTVFIADQIKTMAEELGVNVGLVVENIGFLVETGMDKLLLAAEKMPARLREVIAELLEDLKNAKITASEAADDVGKAVAGELDKFVGGGRADFMPGEGTTEIAGKTYKVRYTPDGRAYIQRESGEWQASANLDADWRSAGNMNLDYGGSMGANTIQDLINRGLITVVVQANVPMDVVATRVSQELGRAY